jgi:inosine-uridine nucleoside N-ribohydrolase
MYKVLIDCDPGHDDATAILYAARHLDLVGVTTVYGNQTVDKTTRNALAVLTLLGLDVPVARGCAGPLNGTVRHGGDVHGKTCPSPIARRSTCTPSTSSSRWRGAIRASWCWRRSVRSPMSRWRCARSRASPSG